jgi:hypothetical protein
MAVFFSPLISFMLFAYLLKDFEIFHLPVLLYILYFLTFYLICIYIVRFSYVRHIFVDFLIIFLSDKIDMSINP